MDKLQEFFIGLPMVLMIASPVFAIVINLYYPNYIGTIDKYFYLKKQGNLIGLAYLFRSFILYYVPLSFLILIILFWQKIDIHFNNFIELVRDIPVIINGETIEFPQYFIAFFLCVSTIKWWIFLFKTSKKKDKEIYSSQYITKKIPIPKYLFFILICYIISELFNPNITSTVFTVRSFLSMLMIPLMFLINLLKSVFPINDSLNISYQELYNSFLIVLNHIINFSVIAFIIFCISGLMVFSYYGVKSFFYIPSDKDIEDKKNIDFIFRINRSFFNDVNLEFLSKLYHENCLNEWNTLWKREKKKEKELNSSHPLEFWKQKTGYHTASETVKWLQQFSNNLTPNIIDLLFLLGFSISITIVKTGIPLLLFWVLASRIEVPLYILMIIMIEQYAYITLKIYHYMKNMKISQKGLVIYKI